MRARSLVPALLFCFAACAAAAGTLTVTGSVADGEGRPLAGALVVVVPEDGGQGRFAVTTDKDGAFRVRGVEPGTYRVAASARGFVERAQNGVRFAEGKPNRVEIKLSPRRAPSLEGRAAAKGAERAPDAAKRAERAPDAAKRADRVLAGRFTDDLALQRWLDDRTAEGLDLLALAPGGEEGTLFVFRPRGDVAPRALTVVAASEPPGAERLALRIAQARGKTFLGCAPLGPDRRALIFADGD